VAHCKMWPWLMKGHGGLMHAPIINPATAVSACTRDRCSMAHQCERSDAIVGLCGYLGSAGEMAGFDFHMVNNKAAVSRHSEDPFA
jgi:hypothetical protein